MTIRSVETLEALPLGSTIQVMPHSTSASSRSSWTKEDRGWVQGTAVLESAMFGGYVAQGLVVDAAQVAPVEGEWWVSRHYHLWVVAVDQERRAAACLAFGRDDLVFDVVGYPLSRFASTSYRRLEAMPEALSTQQAVEALARWGLDHRDAAHTHQREFKNRPDPRDLRPDLERIQRSVHALLSRLEPEPGEDLF